MERFGDFFPENPQNARRAARGHGPAHGGDAGHAQLDDARAAGPAAGPGRAAARGHGPALAGRPARRAPARRCSRRWAGTAATTSAGRTRSASPRRSQLMQQLGDIDQLENLLRGATNPGALAEVDIDRVRDLLGDDAARILERLAELAKMLEEAGLIENKEGRYELTPKGIRRIGSNALQRPVHASSPRTRWASTSSTASASATSARTRPSPTSSATRSTSTSTARSATPSAARAAARRCGCSPTTSRSSAPRTLVAVEHRAHARPVAVDADARQLPRRQEGGDGAALADLVAVPARLPRHRRLQRGGPRAEGRAAARGRRGTSSTARTCSTRSC